MKNTKKLLTTLLFSILLPISIFSQSIEEDKIIPSLNKRIIRTSWEKTNWGSDKNKLEISMLLEGRDTSLLLNWQCREMVGAERDARIVLYFSDMSTIALHNKAFSVSGVGKVASNNVSAATIGIQFDAKGDFRILKEKQLVGIRVYTTIGHVDFPIEPEEYIALKNLYNVFEKQILKEVK